MRTLRAGTALFRQGDQPFAVFRLMSGQMRLLRVTPNGAQVPMHTVGPGELFAEASLFSPRYHCNAVATKDSTVLVYPKGEIVRQLKADPEEMWKFAAELAHRVQGLRTRLEVRQIRSAPERVLQALCLRCEASGRWKQDGTLKQFAEELGLTHEALYRALTRLEQDGRITRRTGEIWLEADKRPR
ncbi:Crp/Fnr family transcriptional regulator [Noviherbaspirillum massiliense]|uniref:Crp/Fnr family transcriptional regulator n=1 Tax=Noviherbaspirillum massiliense TaxID=1465823 RepID=UPI001C54F194|nr:Crp/Fnr family transcriptional regulator [Noviherbaspirillum massiliense]